MLLFPLVTPQLIEKLRGLFPAAPTRGMTQRELDHMIGQLEVIRYLEQLLAEQESNDLEDS